MFFRYKKIFNIFEKMENEVEPSDCSQQNVNVENQECDDNDDEDFESNANQSSQNGLPLADFDVHTTVSEESLTNSNGLPTVRHYSMSLYFMFFEFYIS